MTSPLPIRRSSEFIVELIESTSRVNYMRQKTVKYAILYADNFFKICAEISGEMLLFAQQRTIQIVEKKTEI